MKFNFLVFITLLLLALHARPQSVPYFPPKLGPVWDTLQPAGLGWNQTGIDSLLAFLDYEDTKAFLVLKNGKMVIEQYFGTFTKDSLWYWASAGKTITAFLVGKAQEEGFLSIEDTSSKWLGAGWTSCSPPQEAKIRVRHQLMMSTGFNDYVPDDNCEADSCLICIADTVARWAYHNAPYLRLQDVVANATGMSYQAYTNTRLKNKTGMTGFWYDKTYYSRARDMARFGILIQNHGIWDTDTVLADTNYFHQMVNSSQSINKSYGYLWWLNGKGSHMLPDAQLVFPMDLIPAAPDDCIAALGKNEQKLYIVPSQGLVVVRMGEISGLPHLATQSFDNELWTRLMIAMGQQPSYSISGSISYANVFASPLDSIQVILLDSIGNEADTCYTNAIGSFTFPEVYPGQYGLRMSSGKSWGGVNATDCLLIMKHFVNMASLSGIALAAADVSGDAVVNSVDALLAAKRFTGMTTAFPVGDWAFPSTEIVLTESIFSLDIKALCYGDVNGSLIP